MTENKTNNSNSFPEYKGLNLPEVDQNILSFWNDQDVFKQSVAIRNENNPFVFYEGPPSANGMPGIHHVMGRTIKDLFCRYKSLKGFRVERKGGWDTHGLPIELGVEKKLGITKEDIGKSISIEEYNKTCREEVMRFKDVWDDLTVKMGYWVDLENPYITFKNDYIESVWNLLKQIYDKELLYKGYTIQPYSPAAGTGLSSHELNMPGTYQNVKDTSATAQFKVVNNERSKFLFRADEDVYILAWTTTPWTLPGNCALAIGNRIDYVKVKTFNPYTFQAINVILAKELVPKYFSEKAKDISISEYKEGDKLIPFEIVDEYKGSQLMGVQYEQLLPYVTPAGKAFEVIDADFVSTEDGTGIVHTASLFGADDFKACQAHGISSILVKDQFGHDAPIVDLQGRFVSEITDFAGQYVREEYYSTEERNAEGFLSTDVQIAIKLKTENKAFKVEKYEHSYPHCWRTDKPILYYPLNSWFVKTTAMKDRLLELNATINWNPASTGEGRFGKWIENLVDWNLSRSRYWGTPLPVWQTEDKKETKCIGSMKELHAEVAKSIEAGFMEQPLGENFDLHRPFVDDIILVSEDGQRMMREPDLIDVWFDSGAMPYAQWHYPFENEEKFKANYPADFIAEGIDQTRGWFFTLHTIATLVHDSVAFKNVVSNGLVLDKNGNKMSKRLGNTVDPFEMLTKYGADATRWYIISNSQPWDNLKFDVDGIEEVRRKFFGTLYNTYSFFALYANVDGFAQKEEQVALNKRPEIDRWIISKLNGLITDVDDFYDDYEPTKAARAIQNFVDKHLSNWYVRLCRRRFWKGEYSEDKISAYQTLFQCLDTVAHLMSPIAPFYSDHLYRSLQAGIKTDSIGSVHLSSFPKADKEARDLELEARMKLAQNISSQILSLRKRESIKVRQPLEKILIPILDDTQQHRIEQVSDLILSEVNVKTIEYIKDTEGLITKKVKPNFKLLGKKLGPKMKIASQAIQALEQAQITELEQNGSFDLNIGDESIKIELNEVEIVSEDIPGWIVSSADGITVALDIQISETLKNEGNARELINKIQGLRKEKKFNVTDRVELIVENEPIISEAVKHFKDYICREILAEELLVKESIPKGIEINVNDVLLKVELNLA